MAWFHPNTYPQGLGSFLANTLPTPPPPPPDTSEKKSKSQDKKEGSAMYALSFYTNFLEGKAQPNDPILYVASGSVEYSHVHNLQKLNTSFFLQKILIKLEHPHTPFSKKKLMNANWLPRHYHQYGVRAKEVGMIITTLNSKYGCIYLEERDKKTLNKCVLTEKGVATAKTCNAASSESAPYTPPPTPSVPSPVPMPNMIPTPVTLSQTSIPPPFTSQSELEPPTPTPVQQAASSQHLAPSLSETEVPKPTPPQQPDFMKVLLEIQQTHREELKQMRNMIGSSNASSTILPPLPPLPTPTPTNTTTSTHAPPPPPPVTNTADLSLVKEEPTTAPKRTRANKKQPAKVAAAPPVAPSKRTTRNSKAAVVETEESENEEEDDKDNEKEKEAVATKSQAEKPKRIANPLAVVHVTMLGKIPLFYFAPTRNINSKLTWEDIGNGHKIPKGIPEISLSQILAQDEENRQRYLIAIHNYEQKIMKSPTWRLDNNEKNAKAATKNDNTKSEASDEKPKPDPTESTYKKQPAQTIEQKASTDTNNSKPALPTTSSTSAPAILSLHPPTAPTSPVLPPPPPTTSESSMVHILQMQMEIMQKMMHSGKRNRKSRKYKSDSGSESESESPSNSDSDSHQQKKRHRRSKKKSSPPPPPPHVTIQESEDNTKPTFPVPNITPAASPQNTISNENKLQVSPPSIEHDLPLVPSPSAPKPELALVVAPSPPPIPKPELALVVAQHAPASTVTKDQFMQLAAILNSEQLIVHFGEGICKQYADCIPLSNNGGEITPMNQLQNMDGKNLFGRADLKDTTKFRKTEDLWHDMSNPEWPATAKSPPQVQNQSQEVMGNVQNEEERNKNMEKKKAVEKEKEITSNSNNSEGEKENNNREKENNNKEKEKEKQKNNSPEVREEEKDEVVDEHKNSQENNKDRGEQESEEEEEEGVEDEEEEEYEEENNNLMKEGDQ